MNKPLLVVALYLVPMLLAPPLPSCLAQGQTKKTPAQLQSLEPAPSKKEEQSPKKALISNHPRQVIKFGQYFLLMDESGLMPPGNKYGYGLYRDDTRFLNAWDLRINNTSLTLLYRDTDDGYAGRYIYENTSSAIPDEKIFVERHVLINDRVLERISLTNYDTIAHDLQFSILFGSDFADMFEVRGQNRKQSGTMLPSQYDSSGRQVDLSYRGLDKQIMQTSLAFSKHPTKLNSERAVFSIKLEPHQSWDVDTAVAASSNGAPPKFPINSFVDEQKRADAAYTQWRRRCASIVSDNQLFNRWIERNFRDIYILRQATPRGDGIAAGVPWFAVAFGRDQEITSLETLPFMPDLTRNVLTVLSAYQGAKSDPFTEEEPGSIMHELRLGEMARLREIPFVPYYGTVDATPLFLVLLGRYVDTTGDIDFARSHWDNVKRALAFIEHDINGSGYLRYGWRATSFLSNKGWKDSGDSVMYSDGSLVKPQPIALSEVQGYLYSAWMSVASMAGKLGFADEEKEYRQKAQGLRARFQKDFWMDKEQFVALALDGKNVQCDVVSSNPGHLLSTGLLSDEQEKAVIGRMMQPDMFSGWGVRTLSSKERAYNPLSYHDGSIWPHDNAMISYGLGCTHRTDLAAQILSAMFRVAKAEPDFRLPELFCGFASDYAEKPIWYPVSCSPQAWAAGSMFMMLQGALGLSIKDHSVSVHHPHLPIGISKLEIRHMPVDGKVTDLTFTRSAQDPASECTVDMR